LKKHVGLRHAHDGRSSTRLAERATLIEAWLGGFSTRVALTRELDRFGIAWAEIRTPTTVLDSPTVRARDVIAEVDDRNGGTRPVVRTPYRFSEARSEPRGGAAHSGEHNRDVLTDWLGLSAEEIDGVETSGAFIAVDPGTATNPARPDPKESSVTEFRPDARIGYPGTDGTNIVTYRWDPAGPPRAAVQVTHGMGDHALRYGEFARSLTARGLVVYAQDHRGHGATATSPESLGQLGIGGWAMLVNDIHLLTELISVEHPDRPLALVAHSLGSFATQQYLLEHSRDIDAVLLSGTSLLDMLQPAFDLDQPLDLTSLNAQFEPARTQFDWLTRDDAIVDAYIADPLCGFGLDTDAGKEMFAAARRLADPAEVTRISKDLPVYLFAGVLDPVNGEGALIELLADRLRTAGVADVTVKLYPDARHEILNETNRARVAADLIAWLEAALALRDPHAAAT
jgi:alpha-beta hydrolase superfamily lysophospholipase